MSVQERHRLAIYASEVRSGGKALAGEAFGMRPPGRRADLHRQVMIGRDGHVAAIDGGERPAPLAIEQRQERREVGQRLIEFVDQAGLDAAIGQHDGRHLQAIGEAGHDSSQQVGRQAFSMARPSCAPSAGSLSMRTFVAMPATSSRPTAVRGPVLTYTGDPFRDGLDTTMVHEPDAIVVLEDGKITHFGPADRIARELPSGIEIRDYGKDALISAGFVDSHVHFPQTPVIAAYGAQLLDWLNEYTYPAELKFADKEFAREVARVFLQENLRNGVTTSCVYCTVHPQSVDALFEEAEKLGLRLAAGKVLMDRNAPDGLRDTAQSGYAESQALIAKWHGRGRLLYAITPRFAGSSSPEQLAMAGRLWREHPECLMQTHIAENRDEVAWIKELFPDHPTISTSTITMACAASARCSAMASGWRRPSCSAFTPRRGHRPLPDLELLPGQRRLRSFPRAQTRAAGAGRAGHRYRRRHLVLDPGHAGRGLQGRPAQSPDAVGRPRLVPRHPRRRARPLSRRPDRQHRPGLEADLVVLDMRSTPLIDFRMKQASDLAEQLFVQTTLADDRAVQATYVAGRLAYETAPNLIPSPSYGGGYGRGKAADAIFERTMI